MKPAQYETKQSATTGRAACLIHSYSTLSELVVDTRLQHDSPQKAIFEA